MNKTIILTVTAIAILTFAESNNIAIAAEADVEKTRTECTRKRDPRSKTWRNRCRTVTVDESQNENACADSQDENCADNTTG